jgi:gamma-glutamyltranspeptidase/glutathione hydrolase
MRFGLDYGTMFNMRILPRTRSILLILMAALAAGAARAQAQNDVAGEQPVRFKHAMVVSVHHDAADAGVEVLRAGGNAVDAAVATGFALAVVHPEAGNLGGGGFMLIRMHTGKQVFVDYREKAPLAATAGMYLNAKGEVIDGASTEGYRAIGVPGSVAGMTFAEHKYGKLGLRQVMAPAIRLAREGFVLSAEEAESLHDPDLANYPESKRIFQRGGDYYREGERFKQPELARTLERIAASPGVFYYGSMAREIAAAVKKGGGLITEADLAAYEVKEREPLVGSYRGYTIVTAPPPSAGGTGLIETLNMLEGYNLERMGDRTPQEIHLVVEAFRRAYMDRGDYMGDPDFTKIPVEQLTDKRYAAAWRGSIKEDAATASKTLERPGGLVPAPLSAMAKAPEEHAETTHFSVMDAEGNAVAVTTTLNGVFGSHVTVEGLGFLLNNEMDDFAARQGVANMFGLVQGPTNSIAPGKRPLSSMTPTIVLKDGKVRMVLGSPGGGRITSTVANILLSVADEGLNVQAAVDAPRFHHQYLPDVLELEPGFNEATVQGLRGLGYKVHVDETWSDGECIVVDAKTGELEGGQDHRQHFGAVRGY